MTEFFQFFAPTKIIAEPGISRNFAHELQQMQVAKIFIVTDENVAKLHLSSLKKVLKKALIL